MKSLSVCVTCSDPITSGYPLRECLLSAEPIADEIVFVNGDSNLFGGEVDAVLNGVCHENYPIEDKLKGVHIPWNRSLMKNMYNLANSVAISQCTKDYILWLDSDEVLHEEDYDKIEKCLELDKDAYSFRTIHFYRDYDHFKSYKGCWYNYRPKLFRNNLGIWDGYQSWIDENGVLRKECTSDLITWDYKPVHAFSSKTSITVYHYGWVLSIAQAIAKKNKIEFMFHPEWHGLMEWKWDMSDTELFVGTHPPIMKERIKDFLEKGK